VGAGVTERLGNQNLKISENEFAAVLLKSTGEGVYGIDLDGLCTFANPACARMLGFDSSDELLGQHMHNLAHHTRPNGVPYPEAECRIYKAFRRDTGVHVDDEVMFRRDGTSFPTEYRSHPIHHEGRLIGSVLTFTDITERLQLELKLRQAEKVAALGKLSAGMAHELNNPAAAASRSSEQLLGVLRELREVSTDLARAQPGEETLAFLASWYDQLQDRSAGAGLDPLALSDRESEVADWLDSHGAKNPWDMAYILAGVGVGADELDSVATAMPEMLLGLAWLVKSITAVDLATAVSRSSHNIAALVEVVKSYSNMDAAPNQTVDIQEGIEQTLTLLSHLIGTGVTIAREYDQELPKIEVRPGELNQVWMNLLDNAIYAVAGSGTITITTSRDGDHMVVQVADDGSGIHESIISEIFDPFFTGKPIGTGAGLGLAVVYRTVHDRCDGTVEVRSQPGDTVFTVRLPVVY
jgi:PAS domain S-box-containing protein